jgi:hypothetical protein
MNGVQTGGVRYSVRRTENAVDVAANRRRRPGHVADSRCKHRATDMQEVTGDGFVS